MFALFGAVGQTLYDIADARQSTQLKDAGEGRKKSWLDSKWSPVTVLSDEQYETILRERLARVDAEIMSLDKDIAGLKDGNDETGKS